LAAVDETTYSAYILSNHINCWRQRWRWLNMA